MGIQLLTRFYTMETSGNTLILEKEIPCLRNTKIRKSGEIIPEEFLYNVEGEPSKLQESPI